MAERIGFEPMIRYNPYAGLANRCLQPLGQHSLCLNIYLCAFGIARYDPSTIVIGMYGYVSTLNHCDIISFVIMIDVSLFSPELVPPIPT